MSEMTEVVARRLCCLRFHGKVLEDRFCAGDRCVAWKDHIHEAKTVIAAIFGGEQTPLERARQFICERGDLLASVTYDQQRIIIELVAAAHSRGKSGKELS